MSVEDILDWSVDRVFPIFALVFLAACTIGLVALAVWGASNGIAYLRSTVEVRDAVVLDRILQDSYERDELQYNAALKMSTYQRVYHPREWVLVIQPERCSAADVRVSAGTWYATTKGGHVKARLRFYKDGYEVEDVTP